MASLTSETVVDIVAASGGKMAPAALLQRLESKGFRLRQVNTALQVALERGELMLDSKKQLVVKSKALQAA